MAVTLLTGRCRGTVRSPARYLYSDDSTITGAIGAARELAVIARVGGLIGVCHSHVNIASACNTDHPAARMNVQIRAGATNDNLIILLADNGVLKDLQWNDVSCGACGGRKSNRCLTAKSSDATQYSCTGR
jgi:hypothetical protein